jgi:hypothetical protein
VIGVDPLQILGVERAVNRPTTVTGGTRGLDWAGIAGGGVGPIDDQRFGVLGRPAWEPVPFGALVLVPLAIIGELRRAIEGCAVPVGQRDVSPDARVLDGLDVLDGAVRGVADRPFGVEVPAVGDRGKCRGLIVKSAEGRGEISRL